MNATSSKTLVTSTDCDIKRWKPKYPDRRGISNVGVHLHDGTPRSHKKGTRMLFCNNMGILMKTAREEHYLICY